MASFAGSWTEVHRDAGSNLAALAGVLFGSRIVVTLLFFPSEPATGTAVVIAAGVVLFICSLTRWLMGEPSPWLRRGVPAALKWIVFYLALVLASIAWSLTPSTPVAVSYWIGMAADVATVTLLMASSLPREELDALLRGFVLSSALVAALAWILPTTADLRLGDEDLLHPNAIGFEFALACLCCIYLAGRHRWAKWLGCALAITLLRTLSKACMIAFLAAAAYCLIKDTAITSRAKAAIGVALGVVLALSWGLLEAYGEIYSQGSQAETLTGRTLIWSTSYEIAMEKPWLGHGFYSFRWVVPPFRNFEPWQAHNEVLQHFFSYGIVGVVTVLGIYFGFFRQLRRATRSRLVRLGTAILLFALIRGLVDTERFDLSFPLWLMSAVSLALASRDRPVPANE